MTAEEKCAIHPDVTAPSPWITRFSGLFPQNGLAGGEVLDLACGGGRHSQLLLNLGYQVTAIDKNTDAIAARLGGHEKLEIITADLESGSTPFLGDGALSGRMFEGIVVVNYLYRGHLDALLDCLKPGGGLIYETFARGNEAYGRPRNPDHLLRAGELLEMVRGRLQVVAYEHGLMGTDDTLCIKQRIVAVSDLSLSNREDDDPSPHRLSK